MSAPALLLTILFIADDPQQPMVVIDVVEDGAARSVDVVVVPGDRPALFASLRSGPADGPRGVRRLPLLPTGAALSPAADGAIVTIDDIGLWQDPVLPPTDKAQKKPSSSSKAAFLAPDLPVASPETLRLFLPLIIDEPSSSNPVPASLHGSHTRAPGTALVLRRAVPVVALSVTNGVDSKGALEADGGPAITATTTPGSCAPIPTRVIQELTSLASTSTACTQRLAVSRATGKRFGEKPDKDKAANGVVVVRRP